MTIFERIENAEKLNYYEVEDVTKWLVDSCLKAETIKTNKKITYYNLPSAFDIETTSFYNEGVKCSTMYIWMWGINFNVIVGRTWEEFLTVYNKVVEMLGLHSNYRLTVYVHNLSYEFQFFRRWLEWEKVFSLDKREPIQAVTVDGLEFRCSYILSGYSLAKLGSQLIKYKVSKKVGDLDYSKLRHSETELTEKEMGYCINDVLVVMAYIQEKMEYDGNITKIPLTKTGYVRRYCRNGCLYEDTTHRKDTKKFHRYMKLMKKLTIEEDEYIMLSQAFMGGFTHANPFFSRGVFSNVKSYDFTSSYPSVMLSEKFPMSKGQWTKLTCKEDFYKYLEEYCCLFEIGFDNIIATEDYEMYIPASKCREVVESIENNGRIYSAKHLVLTITEQDFRIISKFYKWDKMHIGRFIRYEKGYLPTDLIKSIYKFYVDKTELKEVDGKELEYAIAKENLNSVYGMMVTDICRDDIIYNGEWSKETPDIGEALSKYNKSKRRFLFYPWGVWTTAYARKNLFSGIYEFKDDYIYSDTDSLKVVNYKKHLDYINKYNQMIGLKLELAFHHHGMDKSMLEVRNKKGKLKPIGVWNEEELYTRFKTLGAKRYMTEIDGKISLTVSGLNKNIAVPYLLKTYGDNIFDAFDDEMYIPEDFTGKMTHTYFDFEQDGYLTDYNGVEKHFYEKSGVHLKNCEYDMRLSAKYVSFLLNIKEKLK